MKKVRVASKYNVLLPATNRRWMGRFTLLSLFVHGLLALASLGLAAAPQQMQTPPLLRATLIEHSGAAGSELALRRQHTSRSFENIETFPHAPTVLPASRSVSASVTPLLEDNERSNAQQEVDRVNHLRAQLRAALDAQFVYPPLARQYGWQGRVQIALRIELDGRVSELRVLRSSGYAILDLDALRTLERIVLFPQAHVGHPERPIHLEFPVVYKLVEA